jgi:hypothetical protein
MRRGDVEIEIGDLARHVIEQAGPVEAIDLDHGERVRQSIVDHHLRLDPEGRQLRLRLAFVHDNLGKADIIPQQLLDGLGDFLGASLLILGVIELALKVNRVECHAVARG